jgi:hypothetical protein
LEFAKILYVRYSNANFLPILNWFGRTIHVHVSLKKIFSLNSVEGPHEWLSKNACGVILCM